MLSRHTLFIELLGGIGDLLFALPAIDALKRASPTVPLDVLTFAPGGELLIGDPRVHEVFFSRRGQGDDAAATVRKDVSAVLGIHPYDLIVCDTRHSGIHELVEAEAAPHKVSQLWSDAGRDEPISQLFLRRLREEGVIDGSVAPASSRLYLCDAERDIVAELWSSLGTTPGRTVILNPHSGVAVKHWPLDNFVALGQALVAEGWVIAVLAGDDPGLAWKIAHAIPNARFIPKLALRLTAACLEGAALVVSGDSGIGHLANAVGTPALGIYGPTWAGRYGVAEPSVNLQSPFDCPERNPMNFTLQRCWFSGACIYPDKTGCCEDVLPTDALDAAHKLLRNDAHA